MRITVTMTEDELRELHVAASTPGVFTGGMLAGYDPARAASEKVWRKIGKKYGVRWDTIRPVTGASERVFSAEAVPE